MYSFYCTYVPSRIGSIASDHSNIVVQTYVILNCELKPAKDSVVNLIFPTFTYILLKIMNYN